MAKKKLVFIHTEFNGCGHWRMFEPARFLNKMYPDEYEVIYFPKVDLKDVQLMVDDPVLVDHLKTADVVVTQRVGNKETAGNFLWAREISKRPFIMETDDDVTTVDPFSPAYEHWKEGSEARCCALWQADWSDALQTSTLPLARLFREWTCHKKPVLVQPNLIDVDHYNSLRKPKQHDDSIIKIGWTGSATHYRDVLTVYPVLKRISAEFPQVRWVIRGMRCDMWFEPRAGDDEVRVGASKNDPTATKVFLEPIAAYERIDYDPGENFDKWPEVLAAMDCDITFTPLAISRVNNAKSPCRYFEHTMCGYAGIYAGGWPYGKVIDNGKDGLLVDGDDLGGWYRAFKKLITDKPYREAMAAAAMEKVTKKYSLQHNIGIWKENYDRVLKHFKDDWSFRSVIQEPEKLDARFYERVHSR